MPLAARVAFVVLVSLSLTCGAAAKLTSLFKPPPDGLSSTVDDAPKEQYEPEAFALPVPEPLGRQPRNSDGSYSLSPGLYQMEVASFCLHAGKASGGKGDAYLPIPIKGPKGELVTKLLDRFEKHAIAGTVNQREAQALIWAVLSRSKLSEASPTVKATAKVLLTPEEIKQADGDALAILGKEALAKIKLPDAARKVLEAENSLREKFASSTASYEELEAIAAPPAPDPGPAKGTWTRMPEGHLIRFFPASYQQVKIEILVEPWKPPALAFFRRSKPWPRDATAMFAMMAGNSQCDVQSIPDPKKNIAAPKNATGQRLGLSGKDLDQATDSIRTIDSPEAAAPVLRDVAKQCERQVNSAYGYGPDNLPASRKECTKMGTEKHQCMEHAIKSANNGKIHSEVAYDSGGNVVDSNKIATARQRGACAARETRANGGDSKAASAAFKKEYFGNGGAYSARMDALVLKDPTKGPVKGNVDMVYDFKFNCEEMTQEQVDNKKSHRDQAQSYADKLGLDKSQVQFIHTTELPM
jgi:hypothetical protein